MADSKGMTPLHVAALNKDPEFVQLLLEKGAKINVKNWEGKNPLHLAALVLNPYRPIKTAVDTARLLLAHGAMLSVRDKEGQTPLDLAQEELPLTKELVELFEGCVPITNAPQQ